MSGFEVFLPTQSMQYGELDALWLRFMPIGKSFFKRHFPVGHAGFTHKLWIPGKTEVFDMVGESTECVGIVKLQASRFCHLAKLRFLLDSGKATATEIGCNASRATSAEGVEHPVSWVGGCQ